MHLPNEFFLWDDGYYNIGRDFFYGNVSLFHQYRTPGIPALLSLLNFFPSSSQPFIRLIITQLFTLLNIYLAFKIFLGFLPKKTIFWGLLVALLNPLYLWWAVLRSGPEIYLTSFLGLIILFILKQNEKRNWKVLIYLIASILISLIFKPVLFLIPFFVSLYYFVYKKYNLGIIYFFIFIVSITGFKIVTDVSRPDNNMAYGLTSILVDPILTQTLLDSGKLGYYIGGSDLPEENSYNKGINLKVDNWIKQYYEKNHSYSTLNICIDFFRENTLIVILSKLLSPIYFISIADTTSKSLVNLLINSIILYFAFINIKKIYKISPKEISLIIFIFIGFYSIYLLIQSCARYYIPLSFYISVFTGISIINLLTKKSIKTSN